VCGKKVCQPGIARIDISHGRRKSHVGCAAPSCELKMLGFDISERTVLRWMRNAPRRPEPVKRWASFLSNHREAIAAMDFFTVPTLTFGVLYCLFIISHDWRRVLHFNVTPHPGSAWVSQLSAQQRRSATAFKSPWQNGVAER